MRGPLLFTLLLIVGALAGCITDPSPLEEGPQDEDPEASAPFYQAVVAVIDSPVNVYHEHFQTGSDLPDPVLDSFTNTLDDLAPQRIALSQDGDFANRMESDEDVWGSLEKDTLYYFEGTNILAISFSDGDGRLRPGSHGTGVAGSVIDANPDAVIVLVEGRSDGEAWAASQGWIDLLSMSYGPPGSVHLSGPLVYGLTTSESTRLAWDTGKIPVGAADNSPAPAVNDETAGPPWVVGVAGDHPEEPCREHVSALVPDFTADFTQELPEHESTDGYRMISGTSFATPTTAGTLSRVLLEVRQAWNHTGGIQDGALAVSPDGQTLDNSDLREAVNRTAVYFDTQTDCGGRVSALPVNPIAPWAQQGWGHIGPEIVAPTVDHLLDVQEAPEKPMEAQAFMDAMRSYRETLWMNT